MHKDFILQILQSGMQHFFSGNLDFSPLHVPMRMPFLCGRLDNAFSPITAQNHVLIHAAKAKDTLILVTY